MKKTLPKLVLRRETVRKLTDSELVQAVGGDDGVDKCSSRPASTCAAVAMREPE